MPSEKVLETKKAQVAETVEILKAAQTGVLVDYLQRLLLILLRKTISLKLRQVSWTAL